MEGHSLSLLFEVLVPDSWVLFSSLLIHTPAEGEWKFRSRNVGAGLGSSQCPVVRLWQSSLCNLNHLLGKGEVLVCGLSWARETIQWGNWVRVVISSHSVNADTTICAAAATTICGTLSLQQCTWIENPFWKNPTQTQLALQ